MKSAALIFFSLSLPTMFFSIERTLAHRSEVDQANKQLEETFDRFGEKLPKIAAKTPVPAVYAFWLSLLYGGLGTYCMIKAKPKSKEYEAYRKLMGGANSDS